MCRFSHDAARDYLQNLPPDRQTQWSPIPRMLENIFCSRSISALSTQRKFSDYMRPVNWVVSSVQSVGATIFVVMSPYEVNKILPEIRMSTTVHLHQHAPRVTHHMKTFEDLSFYCVPGLDTTATPHTDAAQYLGWKIIFAELRSIRAIVHIPGCCTFGRFGSKSDSAKRWLYQTRAPEWSIATGMSFRRVHCPPWENSLGWDAKGWSIYRRLSGRSCMLVCCSRRTLSRWTMLMLSLKTKRNEQA